MLPYVFPLFSILLSFCFISFLELLILETSVHFTSVQSLSRVWLFMTPWIAARQHARPPCWRRQWHPTPVLFCLENPMDGGAWWAAVHGVTKSPARLSHFTLTFHFHALEKEMATHSSVLAWRIPGTGAWWATVYGVAQSWTQLTWLSSSSSSNIPQRGKGLLWFVEFSP